MFSFLPKRKGAEDSGNEVSRDGWGLGNSLTQLVIQLKMSVLSGCCAVVILSVLFPNVRGELSKQTQDITSKFLPLVINTWGPPFTNATSEGKNLLQLSLLWNAT